MKTGVTLRYGEAYVEPYREDENQNIPYDYIMEIESLTASQSGQGPIRVNFFDKSMILTDIKSEGWLVCGLIDCQILHRGGGTNLLKASINVIDPKGHSMIIFSDEFNFESTKYNNFSALIKFLFNKLNELLLSRYCASTGKRLPQLIFQKLICNTFCLTCKQTH